MAKTAGGLDNSLLEVNDLISAELAGIGKEIFDFDLHPFNFMGKAARARFTLLLAGALRADAGKAVKTAAAAELAHTASLMHDDCLDMARYRRGLPTLYDQVGVNTAILVGDLLITLALETAGRAAPDLPQSLLGAVKRMTEGALIEENSKGKKISPELSQRIVSLKTGALFRWCALAACSLAGRPELLEPCARIGEDAGCAFQIIDDVLDFEGDAEACGKETLQDIKEGKFTLPLILALNDPSAGPEAEKLLASIRSGPEPDLAPALKLAALIRDGGFSAEARKAASEKIAALSPVIDKFPAADEAAALKAFLAALSERTA